MSRPLLLLAVGLLGCQPTAVDTATGSAAVVATVDASPPPPPSACPIYVDDGGSSYGGFPYPVDRCVFAYVDCLGGVEEGPHRPFCDAELDQCMANTPWLGFWGDRLKSLKEVLKCNGKAMKAELCCACEYPIPLTPKRVECDKRWFNDSLNCRRPWVAWVPPPLPTDPTIVVKNCWPP
jgi:hypothetical protein